MKVSCHGDPLEVHSPFDGTLVGTVPTATERDVDAAVRSARSAQRAWSRVAPRERARIIARFARLVLDEEARILNIIQQESGKNRLSAFEEVMDVVRLSAYYAS
ncbi:aldehyde dehydrogenase family protein, partial [Ancrocorticia sp.]|uniref:aldehyde dehydrogenase family protein n=1 Tax=Ancrocorticia sp. TaxID=2593684 RepID=UPI003F8EE849